VDIFETSLFLSFKASKILGFALAVRSTKWWTEELTMEMRGVMKNCWAEERSFGRRRRARRKVETTLTVMDDLELSQLARIGHG
jgi:hypothetical protein